MARWIVSFCAQGGLIPRASQSDLQLSIVPLPKGPLVDPFFRPDSLFVEGLRVYTWAWWTYTGDRFLFQLIQEPPEISPGGLGLGKTVMVTSPRRRGSAPSPSTSSLPTAPSRPNPGVRPVPRTFGMRYERPTGVSAMEQTQHLTRTIIIWVMDYLRPRSINLHHGPSTAVGAPGTHHKVIV